MCPISNSEKNKYSDKLKASYAKNYVNVLVLCVGVSKIKDMA